MGTNQNLLTMATILLDIIVYEFNKNNKQYTLVNVQLTIRSLPPEEKS